MRNRRRPSSLTLRVGVGLALLPLYPAVAFGGPHAQGVLVPHVNASLEYTSSSSLSYEGYSGVSRCADAITESVVSEDKAIIWFVLASFDASPGPVDLVGIDFGFADFDGSRVWFADYGGCNSGPWQDLELPTNGWPGPREGTALVFDPPRRTRLVEIYWFASYVYGPVAIELSIDPATDAGVFGDGSTPPQLDEVWDFGILGFGREGYNPCGGAIRSGACCLGDECRIVTRDECEGLGGQYLGDNTRCFPNPCREQVIETSWGRLKGLYR